MSKLTRKNGLRIFFAVAIYVACPTAWSSPQSITDQEAARFLSQATMGYTESEIAAVQSLGYKQWLENQFSAQATLTEPYILTLKSRNKQDIPIPASSLPYHKVMSAGNNVGFKNAGTAWMRAVLGGEDLLRQRVAWALSQILVTANKTNKLTQGITNYYDILLARAFDHYNTILLDVTYHPVMGRYLSYLGNRKANTKKNRYPDENYARELMQLFTIGLWQLEPNGNRILDKANQPIPTYDNKDIEELARVFTGFHLTGERFGKINWNKFSQPMSISNRHHDFGAKTLLNGHISIKSKTVAHKEISQVINSLAIHPNTAPFISRKLINHMVTSNPTPDYIGRVVERWRETNGNMEAVITSILLDPEARDPDFNAQPSYGRLKSPLLRLTNLLKALDCGNKLGTKPTDFPGLQWWRPDPNEHLNQSPMRAPSVFNFFESEYARPGLIATHKLNSPEFQILTDVTAASIANYFFDGLTKGFHRSRPHDKAKSLQCDLNNLSTLGDQKTMEKLNLLLAAKNLSKETISIIVKQAKSLSTTRLEQTKTMTLATLIAPETAIQR